MSGRRRAGQPADTRGAGCQNGASRTGTVKRLVEVSTFFYKCGNLKRPALAGVQIRHRGHSAPADSGPTTTGSQRGAHSPAGFRLNYRKTVVPFDKPWTGGGCSPPPGRHPYDAVKPRLVEEDLGGRAAYLGYSIIKEEGLPSSLGHLRLGKKLNRGKSQEVETKPQTSEGLTANPTCGGSF